MDKRIPKIPFAIYILALIAVVVFVLIPKGAWRTISYSYMNPVKPAVTDMTQNTDPAVPSQSDVSDPIVSDRRETMAWIYPGEPSCDAKAEYGDGRTIDVLKPEYFSVNEQGGLVFLSEADAGCNGYSPDNIADVKAHSKEQFVTVSASYAKSMDILLSRSVSNDADVKRLVDFVATNGMTGIELDFEDFGGWNAGTYGRFKQFTEKLGTALHEQGKQLMIDGPAIASDEEKGWYQWRYEDFVSLPVDHVVVMAYDYQFDHGTGTPISPLNWTRDVIRYAVSKFPDTSRITIGIPSYGYRGESGTGRISILTYDQTKKIPGFSKAKRDVSSGEMTWTDGGMVDYYQDGESMSLKRKAIEAAGIYSVSVWHLGGNTWFSSGN